jgi:pimeloyl-ACP methyl ester carboxylesterase
MQSINFKNTPVNFIDQGKGRPVVFLHGFLESSEMWLDFIADLSSKYRVVAIDLPGHGETGCLGYVHSMELMADCVKHILKQLKIRKSILVGHSMGGYVSMAFAEKYPDDVKGLCLFHSSAAADNELKKKDRDRMIELVKYSKKDFIKSLIPNLFYKDNKKKYKKAIVQLQKTARKTPKQGIIAALEGMKERREREIVLRFCSYPIMFIIGSKDPVFNFDALMEQSNLPRNATTVILDNVGHMGFIEAKEETLKSISNFAKKAYSLKEN